MRSIRSGRSLRNLLACILGAVALLCIAATLGVTLLGANGAVQLNGGELLSEYVYGTQLSVPQASISVDGKELQAESLVHYPSGKAYKSSVVLLDEAGEYKVEYRAADAGKEYREYKHFTVYKTLFNVAGGFGASAEYAPSYLEPEVDGINVQLASGSKFYYNQVIDLTTLDENTPFVSAFISPTVRGELDGYTLYFRLTDVYDSENYVTFKCNSSRAGIDHGVTYILCGAADQTLTGVEWNWGRVHRNNIYGYPVNCSFYGKAPSGASPKDDALSLYFDLETMVAKADDSSLMIVDLDDPTYFSDSLFLGFTTGEVTLSIWAEDLVKPNLGLEIVSVADHDLSEERMRDEKGPEISVDFGDYEEFPVGVAGYDYPLFPASAVDDYSGECAVTTKVYQNYYDETKFDCYVENGVFKPDFAGVYTVEYCAKDWAGNVSRKIYDIEVKNDADAIVITPEGERKESGFVGERIAVGKVGFTGGIGEKKLTVNIYDGSGNPLQLTGDAFIAETVGEYCVEYVVEDFIGQTEKLTYSVNIAKAEHPVFREDPLLPSKVFGGFEYTLPELSAYLYTSGEQEIKTTISVEDANGLRTLGADREVVFSVGEQTKEITVTYTTVDESKTAVSYKIPCVQAFNENGDLCLENYFVTEGIADISKTDSYTAFAADGTKSNATLQFVNSLLDNGLDVEFIVDTARNAYGKIVIRLTDATGASVSAIIEKVGQGTRFTVGKTSISLSKNFETSPNNEFNFIFDQAGKKMTVDGVNYLPVLFTDQGDAFTGFYNHKVELTIELGDITGSSAINIVSVNSQRINNAVIDQVAPRIYVDGVYGGSREFGDIVVLNDVFVGDVVDPDPKLTVRVIGPDGTPVTDVNGRPINEIYPEKGLSFEIKAYGTYSVLYTVKDSRGLKKNLTYNISVLDDVAPVIVPEKQMDSEYKWNETIVVPEVSVSDNISAAENIYVLRYVQLPTGRIVELTSQISSFKASYRGEYVVYFVAYDEAGNQAMHKFTFTCK